MSVTLAVGASTLARMQAIVSRLVAIEEMAGMDVLCSDKTGTLTKNELSLGEPVLIGAKDRDELVTAAALACGRESPDAIDAAILKQLHEERRLENYDVVRFEPLPQAMLYLTKRSSTTKTRSGPMAALPVPGR